MLPAHHPDASLLLDYAAGNAAEPVALLVATHLALCPACRRTAAACEALAAALLESDDPAADTDVPGPEAVLARLAAEVPEPAPKRSSPAAAAMLPQPLRDYLPGPLDALPWRMLSRGVHAFDVIGGRDGARAALLRIRSGAGVPMHGHTGNETTLVLAGGFSDATGHYGRGDVQSTDAACEHRPVADPGGDCYCLVALDGSLKMTGKVARVVGRFVRI